MKKTNSTKHMLIILLLCSLMLTWSHLSTFASIHQTLAPFQFNLKTCEHDFLEYVKESFNQAKKDSNYEITELLLMDKIVKFVLNDSFELSFPGFKAPSIEILTENRFLIKSSSVTYTYMILVHYNSHSKNWELYSSKRHNNIIDSLTWLQNIPISTNFPINEENSTTIEHLISDFENKIKQGIDKKIELSNINDVIEENYINPLKNILDSYLKLPKEKKQLLKQDVDIFISELKKENYFFLSHPSFYSLLMDFYTQSHNAPECQTIHAEFILEYFNNSNISVFDSEYFSKWISFYTKLGNYSDGESLIKYSLSEDYMKNDRDFKNKLFFLVNAVNTNTSCRDLMIDELESLIKRIKLTESKTEYTLINYALLRLYSGKADIIKTDLLKKNYPNNQYTQNVYDYYLLMCYKNYFETHNTQKRADQKKFNDYQNLINSVKNNPFFKNILYKFTSDYHYVDQSSIIFESTSTCVKEPLTLTQNNLKHIYDNHCLERNQSIYIEKSFNSCWLNIPHESILDLIQEGLLNIQCSQYYKNDPNGTFVFYPSEQKLKQYGIIKFIYVIKNNQVITFFPVDGREEHFISVHHENKNSTSALISGQTSIWNNESETAIFFDKSIIHDIIANHDAWLKKNLSFLSMENRDYIIKEALQKGTIYESVFDSNDQYIIYEIPANNFSKLKAKTLCLKVNSNQLSNATFYPFSFNDMLNRYKFGLDKQQKNLPYHIKDLDAKTLVGFMIHDKPTCSNIGEDTLFTFEVRIRLDTPQKLILYDLCVLMNSRGDVKKSYISDSNINHTLNSS